MRNHLKRMISVMLSFAVCITALGITSLNPVLGADDDFNKEEHLVSVADGYNVISLDKNVIFKLYTKNNSLYYQVFKKDYDTESPIIRESKLGVVIDGVSYGQGAQITKADAYMTNRTYSHMGNQSTLVDNGVHATFTLNQGSTEFFIDVRAYNDGVAFRYRFPGSGTRTVRDEYTEFALPQSVERVWAGVNNKDYEPVIESYNPAASSSDKFNAPLTAVLSDNKGYIALLEAGLTGKYVGTNLLAMGNRVYKIGITWDATVAFNVTGDIETGWRLINLADDLNELVNNYNVYHVNEAPDSELYADTSWIVPGRSTWTWLSDYGNPSCTDPKYQEEAIIGAAKLGFEYHIIDDGYTQQGWIDPETKSYIPSLTHLGNVGKQVNVKPLLWANVTPVGKGYLVKDYAAAQNFIEFLKQTGMHGGKVDFWPGEDNISALQLQIDILKLAAENKMVMNYHGVNKPTGLSVTYPNELTREAIRGLENIGNAANTNYEMQTRFLTRQLFTRYLAGHGDYTPACNNAMQIASLILIDSPLNVIATPPSIILQNEAVEFIKSIPTVWDRTVVLEESEIDKMAVYAKEHKGNWFLGGISHTSNTTVNIELGDFLGDGTYNMELWVDKADGSKEMITGEVTKEDTLEIQVPQYRGFAARFSKIEFNRFGGEIYFGDKLEITTADPEAVVKYTTDGSDPLTSNTAKVYSEPIQLSQTTKLRAAISEGDGQGAEISSNFNLIGGNKVEINAAIGVGETTVELKYNFDCDIYYTLDGKQPTENSTKYTGPFNVETTCLLKVVGIPKDGGERVYTQAYVFVNGKAVDPEVQLTDANWVEATTGWAGDPPSKDKNTKSGSEAGNISLGGKQYERGISTNAVGYFVYNIPEGAKRFVGVVGIDDVAKLNANDGHKASGNLIIYFDNVEYLRTPVFRLNEFYVIDIPVPEGAKQIKLYMGDAGDGITCDNISMGNPGWIFTSETEPEPEYIIGDADGDNRVTVADIIAVRNHIMGNILLTGNNLLAANADEDENGNITVADIVAIRRIIMNQN
ncbi:MAG TPA: hypothetical protein GXX17_03530 [Clostridiales bacterium]|nr:hypothetical protein [Clostridiales bacterium]